MNPTCAACMQPITKGRGQKVTIVGTEAFHQKCVLAGGVLHSQRVVLLDRLARGVSAMEEATRQMDRYKRVAQDADAERRKDIATYQTDLRRRETDLEILRGHYANAQEHIRQLQDELRTVKSDLALERSLPRQPIVMAPNPAPPPEEEKKQNVDVDDSSVRFGLLEFK